MTARAEDDVVARFLHRVAAGQVEHKACGRR